jgi:hypothetical protein
LLDQIDADVASLTADGAYDGQVVYDAVAERHPKEPVIVPPRITAVASERTTSPRGEHLMTITMCERMSWQRSSGYNRRSLVETAMFRCKTIIGRRFHARILRNQRIEAKLGCNGAASVVSKRLGKPSNKYLSPNLPTPRVIWLWISNESRSVNAPELTIPSPKS